MYLHPEKDLIKLRDNRYYYVVSFPEDKEPFIGGFVVGYLLKKQPELVKELVNEGKMLTDTPLLFDAIKSLNDL